MEIMTIEERAVADANRVIGESNNLDKWLSHKIAYERVAKEQQEIDIQRAVDKMKGILSMPIMKYITKSDVQPLLDELVKAMKGDVQ